MNEPNFYGGLCVHDIDDVDFKLTIVTDVCSSIHVWRFFDFGFCKSQFDFFTLLVILDELDLKRLLSVIELVFTFKVFYSVFLAKKSY